MFVKIDTYVKSYTVADPGFDLTGGAWTLPTGWGGVEKSLKVSKFEL